MLNLRVTEEASHDLHIIGRYTKQNWGISQRNRYLKEIDKRFYWLRENHALGKNRDEIRKGYYSYQEGHHVIFYIVQGTNIDIIGVLHEKMDFERHL